MSRECVAQPTKSKSWAKCHLYIEREKDLERSLFNQSALSSGNVIRTQKPPTPVTALTAFWTTDGHVSRTYSIWFSKRQTQLPFWVRDARVESCVALFHPADITEMSYSSLNVSNRHVRRIWMICHTKSENTSGMSCLNMNPDLSFILNRSSCDASSKQCSQ